MIIEHFELAFGACKLDSAAVDAKAFSRGASLASRFHAATWVQKLFSESLDR
jgi:hypothetical protein